MARLHVHVRPRPKPRASTGVGSLAKTDERIFAPEGDGLMGPFARKYGKRTGSEVWAFVYLSTTSFGISVLLLLVGSS